MEGRITPSIVRSTLSGGAPKVARYGSGSLMLVTAKVHLTVFHAYVGLSPWLEVRCSIDRSS